MQERLPDRNGRKRLTCKAAALRRPEDEGQLHFVAKCKQQKFALDIPYAR